MALRARVAFRGVSSNAREDEDDGARLYPLGTISCYPGDPAVTGHVMSVVVLTLLSCRLLSLRTWRLELDFGTIDLVLTLPQYDKTDCMTYVCEACLTGVVRTGTVYS